VGGVEPQSETVWGQADKYHVPRIAFVNKMDRVGADFLNVISEIRERLGKKSAAIQMPIGSEDSFVGVIDLLSLKKITWIESDQGAKSIESELSIDELDEAKLYREELIDSLVDYDDSLADSFLMGEEITAEVLKKSIRKATIEHGFIPVL